MWRCCGIIVAKFFGYNHGSQDDYLESLEFDLRMKVVSAGMRKGDRDESVQAFQLLTPWTKAMRGCAEFFDG